MTHRSNRQYQIISSFDLFEGMYIDCEICYRDSKDRYVTAFRNSTLTKVLLLKLQKLEMTYGSLFIEETYIDSIQNEAHKFSKFHPSPEITRHYTEIKFKANRIFEDVVKNNNVDLPQSERISFEIKEKIVTVDVSNIIQLINSVRSDDKTLFTHSVNVAFLNGIMAKWLQMSENDIMRLTKIGLLHDIGKTMIPSEILDKPSILTKEEFEVIKTHPVHSYNILVNSGEADEDVLKAVRGHHEKINGTGYPDKLQSDEISYFSKITTISDIYDAMCSKRVYKPLNSPFEVLEEFSTGRFSDLDTHVINVFLENMPKELVGKRMLMSDDRIGTVVYVNPNKYLYPIVQIDEQVITTSENLKCICSYD